MLSCKHCEVFKNTYLEKHLWTAASEHLKIKRRIQHPTFKYLRCFSNKHLVRCLTVQNGSLEKKAFTEVDKFPYRPPIFWGTQKMGGQNQSVRPIKTQLKTFLFVLYYLNLACSFHFNGSECISGKKAFTEVVDKFPYRPPTFWGTQKMGGQH